MDKLNMVREIIITGIVLMYLISMILGFYFGKKDSSGEEEQKLEMVKKQFEKYIEPLREGVLKIYFEASAKVFAFNLLGCSMFTIGSMLIFPIVFTIKGGVKQGAAFNELKGSTIFSLLGYLLFVVLELIANYLALIVGLNIVLSLILRTNNNFIAESILVYGYIIGILVIQALIEVAYIRKAIKAGGEIFPIKPF